MTLREKVARAIHNCRRERGFAHALWEYEPHNIQSLYLAMADAARAALPVTVEELEAIERGEAYVWREGMTTPD